MYNLQQRQAESGKAETASVLVCSGPWDSAAPCQCCHKCKHVSSEPSQTSTHYVNTYTEKFIHYYVVCHTTRHTFMDDL